MNPAIEKPPRSVCLLRLSALGDACNATALMRALQAAWPDTRFTWIIGPLEYKLLGDLPGVEFIVFDKSVGGAGVRELYHNLTGRRFDLLLLAQVSLRANLLSLLIRADRRIGFDRPRSRELHGLFINERIAAIPFQHQALAFLEFARNLGVAVDNVDRRPPVPDQARDFARRHQPQAGKAVLISPASSHPARNWHVAGYAEIADWLIEEKKRPVILVGGPSATERALGRQIEKAMSNRPTNLIGEDTLKQALAMYERAACVITPDSGPAHMADAMGTPVVGLYAATWSKRSGPLNSLNYCVDEYPAAAEKFAGKPARQLRWGRRLEYPGVMDLVTTDQVRTRVREALKAGETKTTQPVSPR